MANFETNMSWAKIEVLGVEKGNGTTLTRIHNTSDIETDPVSNVQLISSLIIIIIQSSFTVHCFTTPEALPLCSVHRLLSGATHHQALLLGSVHRLLILLQIINC